MRRKIIIGLIFVIGLGIFSYPMVANMFSTSAHQTIMVDYQKTVDKLDEDTKTDIVKRGKEHNEKLNNEEMDFIDPFANGSEDSGNKSYYDALNIGESMGTLKIEEIKVDLPIYHGTSEAVLSKGVGHLENTSLPLGNNGEYSVLTAHRGLPSSKLFRDIDELEVGEEFSVQILDDLMIYKVFDRKVVLPDEIDWLIVDKDRSIVTLLSCEPYMINTHRLLVMGELISKEKVKEIDKIERTDKLKKQNNHIIYLFISILILLIGMMIFIFSKRHKKEEVV